LLRFPIGVSPPSRDRACAGRRALLVGGPVKPLEGVCNRRFDIDANVPDPSSDRRAGEAFVVEIRGGPRVGVDRSDGLLERELEIAARPLKIAGEIAPGASKLGSRALLLALDLAAVAGSIGGHGRDPSSG
jgi:hypothetical protein